MLHLEETENFKTYKKYLADQGVSLGQCLWEDKSDPAYKWPDVFCFMLNGSKGFGTIVYKHYPQGMNDGAAWGTYIESPHVSFVEEANLLKHGPFNLGG